MGLEVIAHAVELDNGVKHVSMYDVKCYGAPGRPRLSRDLCDELKERLNDLGLVTLPEQLPTSESEWVYILDKDSAIGQAVMLATASVIASKRGLSMPTDIGARYPLLAKAVGRG
ncbi:hypothetical protein ABZ686_07865 [Streptomyces sp. NPDC006992]|uniref:hypothetical protein n=1 Tax=unclassified Streptomyces TaxID=2593676 RepID=UPI0033DBC056